MGKGVSLDPEDFTEGGGLIDDVDVVFEECRFEIFDYQGKANPTPCLKIEMSNEDLEFIERVYDGAQDERIVGADD